MVRPFRTAALLLFACAVAAPAAAQDWAANGLRPWQCVTFARAFSGIELFGNAATWWHAAVGRYEQGFVPRVGGVMVFKPFAHMRVGHVATVSEVVSPREIRVTHANWSPVDGRRGQVEENVTVVDTSAAGDWSRVRVWYAPLGDLGKTDYPVYGFIYGHAAALNHAAVAAFDHAAVAVFDHAAVAALDHAAVAAIDHAAVAAIDHAADAVDRAAAALGSTERAIAGLAALPAELAGS